MIEPTRSAPPPLGAGAFVPAGGAAAGLPSAPPAGRPARSSELWAVSTAVTEVTPVQSEDRLLGRLAQRLGRSAACGRNLDGEADIAVLDRQPADHAEGNQILALIGIAHPPQRFQDPFFGYIRHA